MLSQDKRFLDEQSNLDLIFMLESKGMLNVLLRIVFLSTWLHAKLFLLFSILWFMHRFIVVRVFFVGMTVILFLLSIHYGL
jgi:hypothetical protein